MEKKKVTNHRSTKKAQTKTSKLKKGDIKYRLIAKLDTEKIRSKVVLHIVKIMQRYDRPLSVDEIVKLSMNGAPTKNAKGMLPWAVRHNPKVFVKA